MAIHIKDLIDEFLGRKKKEGQNQERIQQTINQFLSQEGQENIYLKGVLRGDVILGAKSSSCSYDFRLKKNKILAEVQKEFPQIKNIKVELG